MGCLPFYPYALIRRDVGFITNSTGKTKYKKKFRVRSSWHPTGDIDGLSRNQKKRSNGIVYKEKNATHLC